MEPPVLALSTWRGAFELSGQSVYCLAPLRATSSASVPSVDIVYIVQRMSGKTYVLQSPIKILVTLYHIGGELARVTIRQFCLVILLTLQIFTRKIVEKIKAT